jgi:alpha-galactosidase
MLLFTLLIAAAGGNPPVSLRGVRDGLALTPPMGWNDWNAYQCTNDWQDVERTALYIHTSGLQRDGYTYVTIDGCWNDMVGLGSGDPNGLQLAAWPAQTQTERDCDVVDGRMEGGRGAIFANTTEFPPSAECANDGIARVAAYIHRLGLKTGLWTDDTNVWNCQDIPGDLGHESVDAAAFASWGIDYLKLDWCASNVTPPGGGTGFFEQTAGTPLADGTTIPAWAVPTTQSHQAFARFVYWRMRAALVQTGRPVVFSMCTGYDPLVQPQTWAAKVANLWRTTRDIADTFDSLTSIVNQNDRYAAYAGPGTWNDPDMLEIGNGGMTPDEDRAELSLWAEMAAPLIIGTTLVSPAGRATRQAYDLSIYGNTEVIAVDQDPLGRQASVASFDGSHLVLARPLANGDAAVVLFNESDAAARIGATAAQVGLRRAPVYAVRDLWTHAETESTLYIGAIVPPHAAVMYRIGALRGVPRAASSVRRGGTFRAGNG